MSYAILQSAHGNDTTGPLAATPALLPFANPVVAGSLLVMGANVGDGTAIDEVVDTQSNTWQRVTADLHETVNGQLFGWWYAWGAHAGSTTVEIGAPTTSLDAVSIVMAEVSGVLSSADPLRVADMAGPTGTPSAATDHEVSNAITDLIGDFQLGNLNISHGTVTNTAGTGLTIIANEPGVSGLTGCTMLQWRTAAGGSETQTATTNTTSGKYALGIAAFKPAPPATPPDPTLGMIGQIAHGRFY